MDIEPKDNPEPSIEHNETKRGFWKQYISISSILFLYLAYLTGFHIIRIICIIGAIILIPTITRKLFALAGLKSPGFFKRALIFCGIFGLAIFLSPNRDAVIKASLAPSRPIPKPTASPTPKPTAAPTATPTPTPTPTPKPTPSPSATPKATASPKAESKDEALVDRRFKDWKIAGKKDRMWAAVLFTHEIFKDKTKDKRLLATAAEQLFECLNSIKPDVLDESPLSTAAAWCGLKLGWANDD
jgi:hypothetical protein